MEVFTELLKEIGAAQALVILVGGGLLYAQIKREITGLSTSLQAAMGGADGRPASSDGRAGRRAGRDERAKGGLASRRERAEDGSTSGDERAEGGLAGRNKRGKCRL